MDFILLEPFGLRVSFHKAPSSVATIYVSLRSSDIISRLDNIQNRGGRANLAEGLRRLRDVFVASRGDRPTVRDIVVVMMAGRPSPGSITNEINALRSSGNIIC